jgi:hypothetical protein
MVNRSDEEATKMIARSEISPFLSLAWERTKVRVKPTNNR